MFSCNLPPALLVEWPGSFMCLCGSTGVEQINMTSSDLPIWLKCMRKTASIAWSLDRDRHEVVLTWKARIWICFTSSLLVVPSAVSLCSIPMVYLWCCLAAFKPALTVCCKLFYARGRWNQHCLLTTKQFTKWTTKRSFGEAGLH